MPSFSAKPTPDGENQPQNLSRTSESEDPRIDLKRRLDAREKVIAAIESRLLLDPGDTHQLFILEIHSKAKEALLAELRRLNLEKDLRYQSLDAYVDGYVQELEQEKPEMSQAQREAMQTLAHEQQIWEDLIAKVRARLIKRPGDPQLMQLLAEHQARLLKVQQNRQMIWAEAATADTLVLESVYQSPPGQVKTANESPAQDVTPADLIALPVDEKETERLAQLASLQRERDVFAGMIEKTRQRLQLKPELTHLQGLIAQHEARLREIQIRLTELGGI